MVLFPLFTSSLTGLEKSYFEVPLVAFTPLMVTSLPKNENRGISSLLPEYCGSQHSIVPDPDISHIRSSVSEGFSAAEKAIATNTGGTDWFSNALARLSSVVCRRKACCFNF